MFSCPDGYATGAKDGTVILWDTEFKPITKVDLAGNAIGYKGKWLDGSRTQCLLRMPFINSLFYSFKVFKISFSRYSSISFNCSGRFVIL